MPLSAAAQNLAKVLGLNVPETDRATAKTSAAGGARYSPESLHYFEGKRLPKGGRPALESHEHGDFLKLRGAQLIQDFNTLRTQATLVRGLTVHVVFKDHEEKEQIGLATLGRPLQDGNINGSLRYGRTLQELAHLERKIRDPLECLFAAASNGHGITISIPKLGHTTELQVYKNNT